MKSLTSIMIFCLLLADPSMAAADLKTELLPAQERWAEINYELPEKQREQAFEALAISMDNLIAQYPERAEPLIWKGIVMSTWAGARGGMGALGLVKDAKALFEQALEIDPAALSGSAYTSLGSLYYQVPGWPLAFGNDKKARELLEQAIKINPDGIDSNYFMADFWLDEGKYDKAKVYFEKAMQAPVRVDRPKADAGRRQEIQVKLAEVNKKLH